MMIERLVDCIETKLEDLAGQRVFLEFKKFGDFSTSMPLGYAKREGKDPVKVAKEWADELNFPGVDVRVQEGFINFFLTDDALLENLQALTDFKPEKKTLALDMSAPNIAKPFSVGHLRSTIIGDSIRRIHELLGWETHGLNFLGDWGTQFGKLLAAYEMWPRDLDENPIGELFELYVKFHEELEKRPELEDDGREWFRRLESGDPKAVKLWKLFRKLSLREFEKTYKRLGILSMIDASESKFVDDGKELVDKLLESGVAERSEGAVVIPMKGDKPPLLLRKSDGTTIYATRDLASALWRRDKFEPDIMGYVVGSDQKLHLEQLFEALENMDVKTPKEHVEFGMVSLPEGKMSTRKGRVVFLKDVLDEAVDKVLDIMRARGKADRRIAEIIGVGAVKFADLKNNRIKNITFTWDMVSFEGETGPYVQYAAVRAKRIGEKFGHGEPGLDDDTRDLARKLVRFRLIVPNAARQMRPDIVANFLLDVAQSFNELYVQERLGGRSNKEWLANRVHLTLETGLGLLGIEIPERM